MRHETSTEIPSSAFISESYFLQCELVVENHAIVVNIEDSSDEESNYPLDVNAVTRSKAKASSSAMPETDPAADTTKAPPSVETKKPPAFTYKSKAASPDAVQRVFKGILEVTVPNITVADLLAISPELRKEAVEHCRTHRVPAPATILSTNALALKTPSPRLIEHTTPLREIRVTLNGVHPELGLLDEGSEIVVIRKDIWEKTKAPINREICMRMQTANGGSQEMAGCVEMLEIDVEGIKTWAHAYVVPDTPYRLLLGRPWQRLVRLAKSEDTTGVHVSVHDPMDPSNIRTITTTPRPWPHPSLALTTAAFSTPSSSANPLSKTSNAYTKVASYLSWRPQHLQNLMVDTDNAKSKREFKKLTDEKKDCAIESLEAPDFKRNASDSPSLFTSSHDEYPPQDAPNLPCRTFAYKKVANKVKPVATTMPSHARIIRRFPEDPLISLPILSPHPPAFTPGKRLTQERMDQLGVFQNEFLLPEERKLAARVLANNELALAWDETEKGRFRDDYFQPVIIPTIEHTPWVHRQPPIPPGIRDEVVKLIKSKIASGVYEPSNSSYQS